MDTELQVQQNQTPLELISSALNKGMDVDKMEKLFAMQERWEKKQAEKAFFAALTEFQIRCPELRRSKVVNFSTAKGTTNFSYAPLADIDRQIKPLMRECGLSKRWEIEDNAGKIKMTCIVTHVDGHSERSTMEGIPDDSGSKNAIQARGSSISYMQRYTLIAALGLTTADADIDARLPELDVDKLHRQYMDVFNKIITIDPSKRTAMDPDSWVERTAEIYVKAIGKARQILSQIEKPKP